MKTQKQRRRVTLFTLIEVVVVIVILVTLASVATPMYMNYIKKSKIATAKTQIKLLDDALQQYKLDVGTYPSDLQHGADCVTLLLPLWRKAQVHARIRDED